MGAYLFVTLFINLIRFKSLHHDSKEMITHVYEAATFAGSIMILMGIFEPPVLVLLGNTMIFLVIAGIGGLLYSIGAFFPRPPGK